MNLKELAESLGLCAIVFDRDGSQVVELNDLALGELKLPPGKDLKIAPQDSAIISSSASDENPFPQTLRLQLEDSFFKALTGVCRKTQQGIEFIWKHTAAEERSLTQQQKDRLLFLEAAIDSIPDPIFVKDEQHTWVEINQSLASFIGESRDVIVGKSDYDYFPNEQADVFWEKDEEVFKKGVENVNEEEITGQDGEVNIISTKKNIVTLPNGQRILVGCIRNVTEYKKLQKQLEENFQQILQLVENIPFPIAMVDTTGSYLALSEAWRTHMGERGVQMGASCLPDLPPLRQDWPQVLEQSFEGQVFGHDAGRCSVNERDEWYRWDIHPWTKASGDVGGAVLIFERVTEKKVLERKFENERAMAIQASKLTALGEVSSGIAHEINNPLSVINGQAIIMSEILKQVDDPKTSRFLEGLLLIEKNCVRITKIITGLKNFSRDVSGDPLERVSSAVLIEDTLDLVEQKLKNSEIIVQLEGPELFFFARPTEIEQVILNLVSNALHEIQNADVRWIKIETRITEDNKGQIRVSDSGPGVDKEHLDKIFQPFFTTKDVGQGTGLGLSISKGIIENHKGSFSLDTSAPDTTFVIELNLASEDEAPTRKAS